ncbi:MULTISPECIES: hypothetical protein [unclassified Streptomyces]|uniref:Secreted protein n=1 Tax=Streptomyces millisiae TaxID=3075542 RepID=A0ABU2LZU1_9ACTN|nr:hypothetical protein [Streptomyces sp. DSM 44918]MDT0322543.1 hypothetical protein [Streptomyces sp. DSM 44918]
MHRFLVRVGKAAAWVISTGAAVGVAWLGVHAVLGAASEPPRAVQVSEDVSDGPPEASSTRRPRPPDDHESSESSMESGTSGIETVSTTGGEVVLLIGPDSAELVSAVPKPGWEVRTREQEGLIRVIFTDEEGRQASVTVLCAWRDAPPEIQTYRG